jgi:hypothetical protein
MLGAQVAFRRHRALLAAVVLIAAARAALFLARPDQPTDFDQLWYAAEALRNGRDPYLAIARGSSPYPLYYPLPAVLLALPLSLLPLPVARVAWDLAVGWTFALALSRRGSWSLLMLASGAYVHAMVRGQVTPLLVAAVLITPLAWLLAIKPNIALALWTAFPSRRAALQCAGVVLLSLVVLPGWPRAMWEAIQVNSGHLKPPVLQPFGWLLLLGGLRWRTAEGRLLVVLALVPQNLLPYEATVLCLVPRTTREITTFVLGTWVPVVALIAQPVRVPLDLELLGRAVWPYLLVSVYLPMLYLVLRLPNARSGRTPVV